MTDSAAVPTNHVHQTGTLRPVWTAQREAGGIRIFKDGKDCGNINLVELERVDELLNEHHDGVARWTAVRDLLLREGAES